MKPARPQLAMAHKLGEKPTYHAPAELERATTPTGVHWPAVRKQFADERFLVWGRSLASSAESFVAASCT